MSQIGILGAGTWGIALSRLLYLNGNDVTVWSAIKEEIAAYKRERRNPNLPDMVIPDEIVFTDDIVSVTADKDILIVAVPSIYVRSTMREAFKHITGNPIIVNVAKGIEKDSLYLISDIIEEEMSLSGNGKWDLVILSGPTHAEEVSMDMPTTIISASSSEKAAKKVQEVFSNDFFRVYTNSDVRGIEICGALKNVIAIAAGISNGLGYGDNAKAALITRGMAEITRLGLAMGCNKDTFFGLAGIGDLVVTATSIHSRNNRAGMLLGQGYSIEETLRKVGMVVEGLNTLPAAMQLAEKHGVEMPIVFGVNDIVNKGLSPRQVVNGLMNRDRKEEKPY